MSLISKTTLRGMLTVLALSGLACQKNEGGSNANPPNPNAVSISASTFESQKDFGEDSVAANKAANFNCAPYGEINQKIKAGLSYLSQQSGTSNEGAPYSGSMRASVLSVTADTMSVRHHSTYSGTYKGTPVQVTSSRTEVKTCKEENGNSYKSCKSQYLDESFDIIPKIDIAEIEKSFSCESKSSKDENKKPKYSYEVGLVQLPNGKKIKALKTIQVSHYDTTCSDGTQFSSVNSAESISVNLPNIDSYGCDVTISYTSKDVQASGVTRNFSSQLVQVILPAGTKIEDFITVDEAKKEEPVATPEPKPEDAKPDAAKPDAVKPEDAKPSDAASKPRKPRTPKKQGPPVQKPSSEQTQPSDAAKPVAPKQEKQEEVPSNN
jgi:hypothetical protein